LFFSGKAYFLLLPFFGQGKMGRILSIFSESFVFYGSVLNFIQPKWPQDMHCNENGLFCPFLVPFSICATRFWAKFLGMPIHLNLNYEYLLLFIPDFVVGKDVLEDSSLAGALLFGESSDCFHDPAGKNKRVYT
jgi:hypothetical protein